MSDNTFGRLLRVTTFGESHGPAIGERGTSARRSHLKLRPANHASPVR